MKPYRLVTCKYVILSILLVPAAAAAAAGTRAVPFELPTMDGATLASNDVFPAHRYTFVVFWDSDCPHCVATLLQCEEFQAARYAEDVAVVGIHVGPGDMARAYRLIESNGITFPQMWDPGDETSQRYGAPPATVTIYLVDRGGTIVARRQDPGDAFAAMDELLAGVPVPTAAPEDSMTAGAGATQAGDAWGGFAARTHVRVRFLSADARGLLAAGPYGEAVAPGNELLYRFELELSRTLTRYLRVGGLLRISNEGEKVLEAGPEYYGAEWGSAFAELTARGAALRLGYYSISSSPLTLMRWDWDDNPRIGGSAGCGCGGAAGALLLNSLEILGPDLTFEGGVASYQGHGLEARLFYGIPRRALRTTYREYRATGEDRARYALEIAGSDAAWRRFDERTGRYWKAAARAVASWEDARSVDFAGLGYPVADSWYKSVIVSADVELPVVRFADLVGEWIAWNKTEERGNVALGLDDPLETTAGGGLAGVVLHRLPHVRVRGDYLRLDPGYVAPFAALSYQPNRQGARFSGRLAVAGEAVAVELFYKRLEEVEAAEPEADKADDSVWGASLDVEDERGLGGGVGWLDEGSWRGGAFEPFDRTRKALVVGARWRPHKTSLLEVQYQRIDVEAQYQGGREESLTHLYLVNFTARF